MWALEMPLPEVASGAQTPFQMLDCLFLEQFWRAVFGSQLWKWREVQISHAPRSHAGVSRGGSTLFGGTLVTGGKPAPTCIVTQNPHRIGVTPVGVSWAWDRCLMTRVCIYFPRSPRAPGSHGPQAFSRMSHSWEQTGCRLADVHLSSQRFLFSLSSFLSLGKPAERGQGTRVVSIPKPLGMPGCPWLFGGTDQDTR